MKNILTSTIAALLFAADKGPVGATAPGPRTAADLTEEQRKGRIRKQAEAAAKTLRAQAERNAQLVSDQFGGPVEVKPTPTADELYEQALRGTAPEPETLEGPTAAAEPRPGETISGPATGRLAVGAPVPEHRAGQVIPTTPTINAPGLGSDSGLKKTADNTDARPGPPDPADNVRTPEVPTPNADAGPVHGDKRLDTPEMKAKRDALEAKVRAGHLPTAKELEEAGVPKDDVKAALESAKAEIARAKKAQETQDAASSAATPPPAAVVQDPKVGEKAEIKDAQAEKK